jgi:hypothetical protein
MTEQNLYQTDAQVTVYYNHTGLAKNAADAASIVGNLIRRGEIKPEPKETVITEIHARYLGQPDDEQ